MFSFSLIETPRVPQRRMRLHFLAPGPHQHRLRYLKRRLRSATAEMRRKEGQHFLGC
jgi:hypothetical protein